MELTVLSTDKFTVAAVSKDGKCSAMDFITNLESCYEASGVGLLDIIERVSADGLESLPKSLCHVVNKNEKIFEFIKGDLRLFFFKGNNNLLVICTTGVIKKSNKVDERHVNKAINYQNAYLFAVKQNTLVIKDD